MTTPQEFLDEACDESRDELTTEQWLEWLEELRDELDMRISMTRNDVKQKGS